MTNSSVAKKLNEGRGAMRICVVGAGAIGSLFAGHLGRTTEVWILTRREEQARSLEAEGLRVSGKSEFIAPVRATADPGSLPVFDLAIVCTKATDLDEAMSHLAGLSPEAVIMTTQNGLGAEEIVRRHGSWLVISAVTFMSGTRHSDSLGQLQIAPQTWRWSEPICAIHPHSIPEAWNPSEPSSVPPIRTSSYRSRSFAAPR